MKGYWEHAITVTKNINKCQIDSCQKKLYTFPQKTNAINKKWVYNMHLAIKMLHHGYFKIFISFK